MMWLKIIQITKKKVNIYEQIIHINSKQKCAICYVVIINIQRNYANVASADRKQQYCNVIVLYMCSGSK